MIYDTIKNCKLYTDLRPGFKEAFDCINADRLEKNPGRYELKNGVYYMVQSYETKPEAEGVFEAHKKYIDIQYIISGREKHFYANIAGMKIRDPYSEEKDAVLFNGKGFSLVLEPGFFAVYFPEDAHMPNLRAGENAEKMIKVVFKIPVRT